MSYIKEEGEVKKEELPTTVTPAVQVVDQKLVVKGRTILENVPENVIATSGSNAGPAGGMFIGAALEKDSSRHVVSLGTLRDAIRAVKLHLKTFWQRHEKKLPGIVDYFGWDAFYQDMTQEGVKAGLDTLATSGTPPKFLIIDDGWQSVGGDPQQKDETKELGAQPQPQLMRLTGVKENSNAGVDGVKVDGQCVLETLGAGLGGRVELTRQYHQALDASVARNFPDNGCIACMSHNTDALYCSKQTTVARASDDFFPRNPMSHTIHIAALAYNSVFLGEFMQPDWDMFHSLHPAAEFHASAWAISGGPVYVSDVPGKHNFDLLKKLVLPDGSVLRARLPGRPTKDCLFPDSACDGISILLTAHFLFHITQPLEDMEHEQVHWSAWGLQLPRCSIERKNTFHKTGSDSLTGFVRGRDVHLIANVALDPDWKGDCAVYSHRSGQLVTLPHNAAMPVSLKVLEQEVFAVTPIKILAPGSSFAPLGLIDMFNAGGAIEGLKYEVLGEEDNGYPAERVESSSTEVLATASLEVKGCGRFGAYSSVQPKNCKVGSTEVEFAYDSVLGLVTFNLDHIPEDQKVLIVKVVL
ncbi:hypothetical protein RJ639_027185 [Escallonia herrerae]|uniref:Raffinose synthase n=1 Tax=Escallonia herrerae TaxID=1293975 RepID=A0AA88XJE7_9ASTE|nr:hypothetical protein RJ639_027185 [Escallonia herrerae]